jgi:hypothetical protein
MVPDTPFMNAPSIREFQVGDLTCAARASKADLREFRANMAIALRSRQTKFFELAKRFLLVPLAIRQGVKGISRYGRNVKQRDGVPLLTQFAYLFSDYFYRIPASDFYGYRLHLSDQRQFRNGHFGWMDIIFMQQYLIESYACEDYPLLKNKDLFLKKCVERGLPVVPLLAEYFHGKMIPQLTNLPGVDLFSKPSDAECGVGANLWKYQLPGEYMDAVSGAKFDEAALIAKLCEASERRPSYSESGKILLQERVSNHASMIGTLTTGGLATIRLVTCRAPSGAIDVLPPVISMPLGNAIMDNVTQGGVAAPVDIATGKICGPAVLECEQFGISFFDKHPTTGVTFDGYQLPYWPEVLDLGRKAHLAFPSMPFIGWDIAILPKQPVLSEGNPLWGIDLSVTPHGLSVADTQFVPYYNYHFSNRPAVDPAPMSVRRRILNQLRI